MDDPGGSGRRVTMRRYAMLIAGLLSLVAAMPAWAQPINSIMPGADLPDSPPIVANPTPSPSESTNFWASTVSSLNDLIDANHATKPPVVSSTSGATLIRSSAIVAPHPEQIAIKDVLMFYSILRCLYP
jgi:hypothetical protein